MPLLAFVQKHLESKSADISKLKKARTTKPGKASESGAKRELFSFIKRK